MVGQCLEIQVLSGVSNQANNPSAPTPSSPCIPFTLTHATRATFLVPAYLVICLLIEHGSTNPKLISLLSPDPRTTPDGSADGESGQGEEKDDEDVAAEARRVERMGMGGTLGDMEGGGR